jgi:Sec-independent protein secretion pathway component TatC
VLMLGPLIALYFMSVGIAYVITYRREKRERAQG